MEGLALGGQAIGIARAVFADVFPHENALIDEYIQPVAQHVPGDARVALDLTEACGAVEGLANDEPCPVVAENVEDTRNRASVRVAFGHERLLIFGHNILVAN